MKEVTEMKSITKIVSKMMALAIVFILVALTCHFSKSMFLTVLVGSIVSPILTVRFYFLLFDLERTLKGGKVMLTAMTEDTRKEVVSGILDCFEELLDKLEITIPCADTEEEEERKMDDNSARLYGMEYWSLYEQVEDLLTTEL